jgi:uncharacterized damage-inducible protein DinB
MTHAELQHLIDYHYWARDRMLAALDALSQEQYVRRLGGSFASIRETAVHIYAAEWVWLERWNGVSPTVALEADAFPDVAALRRGWHELEVKVRAYVAGLAGGRLDERIAYRTFAGLDCEASRWTMVQHVVNHASYHRGQVTTLVRQAGGTAPMAQDLIAYYRERGF